MTGFLEEAAHLACDHPAILPNSGGVLQQCSGLRGPAKCRLPKGLAYVIGLLDGLTGILSLMD